MASSSAYFQYPGGVLWLLHQFSPDFWFVWLHHRSSPLRCGLFSYSSRFGFFFGSDFIIHSASVWIEFRGFPA